MRLAFDGGDSIDVIVEDGENVFTGASAYVTNTESGYWRRYFVEHAGRQHGPFKTPQQAFDHMRALGYQLNEGDCRAFIARESPSDA